MIISGDLKIHQVFSLTHFDSSGSKIGLTDEQANELKDWANAKAKQWNRPLSALMTELRTAEISDLS